MEYNITSKFKHPNSATTLNKTSCVATKYSNILKPDYILFILTRNQLSSLVREGTEAGAMRGDGTRSKLVYCWRI